MPSGIKKRICVTGIGELKRQIWAEILLQLMKRSKAQKTPIVSRNRNGAVLDRRLRRADRNAALKIIKKDGWRQRFDGQPVRDQRFRAVADGPCVFQLQALPRFCIVCRSAFRDASVVEKCEKFGQDRASYQARPRWFAHGAGVQDSGANQDRRRRGLHHHRQRWRPVQRREGRSCRTLHFQGAQSVLLHSLKTRSRRTCKCGVEIRCAKNILR